MSPHEKAVRAAAATMHDAIINARKAGVVVVWPTTIDGLPSIAISETKKSVAEAEPVEKKAPSRPAAKA